MDGVINLKLIVLGEGEVGKSSIIKTFLGEAISERYMPTIGSVTYRKEYSLKEISKIIRLTIWDLGGQKSFNPYNPVHYANADLAILVFDLTKSENTLKNLKKEFEEKMSKSTEECISIFVGNKLDIFELGKKLKNTLQNFFNDRDHFILLSAKTGENIEECFELLIFTYLQRAELLTPDLVQENSANEFLKSIGKDEKSLKSKILNLNSINSALNKHKSIPKATAEDSTEDKSSELKYQEFIQQELSKVGDQKENVLDQFLINLSELEKALTHIKKSHIKSVDEVVDNLQSLLITSKIDFEKNLELIQKLNREENELMIISSKLENEIQEANNKDPNYQKRIYNV
ncbi:MAG: Rab family GTPase [Candidatus Hodarchaeota archaeon]